MYLDTSKMVSYGNRSDVDEADMILVSLRGPARLE